MTDHHGSRRDAAARARDRLTQAPRPLIRRRGSAEDVEAFKAAYRAYLKDPDAPGLASRYIQLFDATEKVSRRQQRQAVKQVERALRGETIQREVDNAAAAASQMSGSGTEQAGSSERTRQEETAYVVTDDGTGQSYVLPDFETLAYARAAADHEQQAAAAFRRHREDAPEMSGSSTDDSDSGDFREQLRKLLGEMGGKPGSDAEVAAYAEAYRALLATTEWSPEWEQAGERLAETGRRVSMPQMKQAQRAVDQEAPAPDPAKIAEVAKRLRGAETSAEAWDMLAGLSAKDLQALGRQTGLTLPADGTMEALRYRVAHGVAPDRPPAEQAADHEQASPATPTADRPTEVQPNVLPDNENDAYAAGRADQAAGTVRMGPWSTSQPYRDGLADERAAQVDRELADQTPPQRQTSRHTYVRQGVQRDYTVRPIADGRWAVEVQQTTDTESDLIERVEFDHARQAQDYRSAQLRGAITDDGWEYRTARTYVDASGAAAALQTNTPDLTPDAGLDDSYDELPDWSTIPGTTEYEDPTLLFRAELTHGEQDADLTYELRRTDNGGAEVTVTRRQGEQTTIERSSFDPPAEPAESASAAAGTPSWPPTAYSSYRQQVDDAITAGFAPSHVEAPIEPFDAPATNDAADSAEVSPEQAADKVTDDPSPAAADSVDDVGAVTLEVLDHDGRVGTAMEYGSSAAERAEAHVTGEAYLQSMPEQAATYRVREPNDEHDRAGRSATDAIARRGLDAYENARLGFGAWKRTPPDMRAVDTPTAEMAAAADDLAGREHYDQQQAPGRVDDQGDAYER